MYTPADSSQESKSSFCPYCGAQVRAAAKFCNKCGKSLQQEAAAPEKPVQPPPAYNPPPPPPPSPPAYNPPPAYTPPSQSGSSDPTQIMSPGQQSYNPPAYTPPGAMTPPGQPPSYKASPQPMPFSQQPSRVNLSLALQYPFTDSNWFVTMLVGGLLIFIPIIGLLAVNGYIVEIIRRVAEDDYDVLPGWEDFGTKLKDGLAITVLLLIWGFLPVFLLGLPGTLLVNAGQEDTGIILSLVGTLLGVFVTYFFLPIVWGRYAVSSEFMSGLQILDIWQQVQTNFSRYIGNWLLTGLMLFISITVIVIFGSITGALMVLLIGFCMLPLVFMVGFYATLVQSHLMGQLYRTIM
jgi:hypothetical protein